MAGVLIVEDDQDIRDSVANVLRDEGYVTTAVANGREAIEQLVAGCRPCLILLDLMMPVMDGWEFREQQRQDPALAQIPVVILSGDGNVRQKANSLDIPEYLVKPFKIDSLLSMVQRYCEPTLGEGEAESQ
jgi:CheY-like chemotaxis protein